MSVIITKHFDAFNEQGTRVGDLVSYTSQKDTTGGVIYRIVEIVDPRIVAQLSRKVLRNVKHYDISTRTYLQSQEEVLESGCWDAAGKKLLAASRFGYARITPVFSFYPTKRGKQPRGRGNTLIVEGVDLQRLKKVSIVELGTKYSELGDLIRQVVIESS